MPFDPQAPLPGISADLPGVGGRIKVEPEDFEVDEIPAYQPCGSGEFLYLWVEKRGIGAEYFVRQIARRLGINSQDVGTAGLKDRHAVTRQMVSVPGSPQLNLEGRLKELDGDGIRVLEVSRHTNKLKPGHLHGNRFRILIRDVFEDAATRLPALVERLHRSGVPNYYGSQRFGHDGETYHLGLRLLRGEPPEKGEKRPNSFLRKLALSAVQSGLFNAYLTRRLADGLLYRVLPGDVMGHLPAGGLFVAEDMPAEQARFDARRIMITGPIFGRKTFAAAGEAATREETILLDNELSLAMLSQQGKLLQGTRRHNLMYVDDLKGSFEVRGIRLSFTLPAGSYATVVLKEIMKSDSFDEFTGDSSPSPL
jgi:tRNA pseudouridine13 synthase